MDNLTNQPDQLEDDRTFARLFSEWGEQKKMAGLMGVSRATVQRQLNSDDEKHASDYHRGRRLAYAAGHRQDEKGELIKVGLDAAYEAGVRDRVGSKAVEQVEFPAGLAHDLIEIELNPATAARVPLSQRRAQLRKLIRELTTYEGQLVPYGEAGSEREGREADSQRPRPVEAA